MHAAQASLNDVKFLKLRIQHRSMFREDYRDFFSVLARIDCILKGEALQLMTMGSQWLSAFASSFPELVGGTPFREDNGKIDVELLLPCLSNPRDIMVYLPKCDQSDFRVQALFSKVKHPQNVR
jgi:hypothetical protein